MNNKPTDAVSTAASSSAQNLSTLYPTREAWLLAVTRQLVPYFEAKGFKVPSNLRVSVGFTSRGGRKAIGQIFAASSSRDGMHEIFIHPSHQSDLSVAATLTHEICHAVAGLAAGHGPAFGKVARAIGLAGKLTSTVAGPEFVTIFEKVAPMVGPMPMATLDYQGPSSGPRKQASRMHKVTCEAEGCGFMVRASREQSQRWSASTAGCPLCNSPLTFWALR